MTPLFAASVFTVSFALAGAVSAQDTLFNPNPTYAQAGQWYIAPNGCSYSRTQAPGQRPVWMLIRNPHHIGGKNATAACARMIGA